MVSFDEVQPFADYEIKKLVVTNVSQTNKQMRFGDFLHILIIYLLSLVLQFTYNYIMWLKLHNNM